MAHWLTEIDVELRRAQAAANPGRLRTAARRIAGIAIHELQARSQRVYGDNYITMLRGIMGEPELPEDIHRAAERLQAQLSADFSSPSVDPISDAMTIVEFVKKKLETTRS